MNKTKAVIAMAALAFLTGCQAYHQSKTGMLIEEASVEVRPLEISVKIGEKIIGTAECTKLFGFEIAGPKRRAYGAAMQVDAGNFVPNNCTKGAIYDATSKSNADIIIAPQYTSVRQGFLCFPFWCLYGQDKIIVTGYKGTFTNIREMSPDVINERQRKKLDGAEKNTKKKPLLRRILNIF